MCLVDESLSWEDYEHYATYTVNCLVKHNLNTNIFVAKYFTKLFSLHKDIMQEKTIISMT